MSAAKERALRRLYARIPELDCKGKCWNSCTIVPATRQELARVQAAGGDLWELLSPPRLAALQERLGGGMPACPSLTPLGACKVYEVRPFMCRAWGTTTHMACEYGCEPTRWTTVQEHKDMLAELARIEAMPDD